MSEEFVVVPSVSADMDEPEMADVPDVSDLAGTPAAAPSPDTPPELKRQRAASTQTHMDSEADHSNGRASSVAAAIMGCSLNEPKLEATFQYESLPLDHNGQIPAKLRLDVAPPDSRPKPSFVDVVLCIDASFSMGRTSAPCSGAALLKEFLLDLFENGVPGKQLNLRVLEFGEEVVDRKFSDAELVRLDDTSRSEFLKIANTYEPNQGCTNISDPVIRGVQVIRDHNARQAERGLTPAEVAHVICLTDGAANAGMVVGDQCLGAARHAMDNNDVFIHYIGLGGSVNAKFMTEATAKGDAGVFSVAADGSKISEAFEEVFGYALETTLPLTVEIEDAKGKRVEKKGMLIKERSLLLDLALPARTEACVANDLSVRLLIGGQPLSEVKKVAINYAGGEFGAVNPKVKELIDSEDLTRQVEQITQNSPSLEVASQAIRGLVRHATETGSHDVRSLRRASAVADDAEESAIQYRSLGANAPQLFAARMSSQAAYA
jgi:hypothetical protein